MKTILHARVAATCQHGAVHSGSDSQTGCLHRKRVSTWILGLVVVAGAGGLSSLWIKTKDLIKTIWKYGKKTERQYLN